MQLPRIQDRSQDLPESSIRSHAIDRAENILFVGFALVVVVLVLWLTASGTRYARIKQHLMSVRIGMSRTEVLAVVGKPQFTNVVAIGLDTNAEIWVFPHKAAESEVPRCVFSGTNGTVVEVVVGEDYRIGGFDQQANPATDRE